MTRLEYLNVIRAIETVEENEKITCKRICDHNPAIREQRERDRDLVLYGLMMAKFEIEKRFEKELANNGK